MTLNWLLHTYQRSLLETLYKNPFRSFYLSELARESGVDPGNTKRYLEKFAERKIVQVEKNGRRMRVRADLYNPETRKIFELFELTRTVHFLESLGERRSVVELFVKQLVKTLPDIRLVGLKDAELAIADNAMTVPLTIVVGSGQNTNAVRFLVEQLVEAIGFVHKFRVCVLNCDNLLFSSDDDDTECVGFWQDGAILYGESYYWEIIELQSRLDPDEVFEEMVQNA